MHATVLIYKVLNYGASKNILFLESCKQGCWKVCFAIDAAGGGFQRYILGPF